MADDDRLGKTTRRWKEGTWAEAVAKRPERRTAFRTSSDIELEPAYGPEPEPADFAARIGGAGEPPFTRGVQPTMYRGRLWTMRQYAGFATAEETNQRYRALLEEGQTGLSVAFDLPTQIGYDPDHPLALGEVGRVGVSIAHLDDMETLLDGIPLEKVSISMTINSTAIVLLSLPGRRGEAARRGPGRAPRHAAERHVQGVHRARARSACPSGPRCASSWT